MAPDLSTISARLDLVAKFSNRYGLTAPLVCAVCEQESSWNVWASRYEPEFERRYLAAWGSNPTEQKHRATSWGLMQVMGQTARELGYNHLLPALCDPENGLDLGCKKLRQCLDAVGGDFTAALLRYNGGSNQNYPVQVLARLDRYTNP